MISVRLFAIRHFGQKSVVCAQRLVFLRRRKNLLKYNRVCCSFAKCQSIIMVLWWLDARLVVIIHSILEIFLLPSSWLLILRSLLLHAHIEWGSRMYRRPSMMIIQRKTHTENVFDHFGSWLVCFLLAFSFFSLCVLPLWHCMPKPKMINCF